jgi:hypothetical protein
MPESLPAAVDAVLRGPTNAPSGVPGTDPAAVPAAPPRIGTLLTLIVIMGMIFGAAMGSYNGVANDHWRQIIFAAIKVPLFLLASFALTLPSFLVLNSLFGLRDDTPLVVRALIEQHAAMTIIMASFAPLVLLWYLTILSYHGAVLFNLLMVVLSCIASHKVLARSYRPLLRKNPKHYLLMSFWQILFAFVAIQMAWILRPFIGTPHGPVVFFRPQTWGNAYEIIVDMLWRFLHQA